jgi:hypothetical protein
MKIHIFNGALLVDIPHTKECAACGMVDSMESDLEICPTCHKCLHWEDEFGPGRCCTCPRKHTDDIGEV